MDRFLLALLHVDIYCADMSVSCSIVVTCWERAALLAVVFVVFLHFPNFFLVHISNKGELGALKLV